MKGSIAIVLATLLSAAAGFGAEQAGSVGEGVPAFTVRPGYHVTVAAEKLDEARFLCFDDQGTLYVSQPNRGAIVALRDTDANGVYRKVTTYVSNKPKVHGMSFHNGWLWFSQSTSINKARGMKPDGSAEEVVTVVSRLPGVTGHWWRSILVDDDGFYTSVGDPGNLTVVDGTAMADREKIWHFDLEGKNKKLFCTGIRNTEKLLYRPGTKELWGCDHGSDNFGEKYGERPGQVQPITNVNPGDEFNHYVEGGFYGHPFIVENNVPRPEFATREDIVALAAKATPPEWLFHAHWAPNGWTFIHKDYFPGMKGDAVMAFHGSWNSTVKVGYRIEHLMFDPFTQKPCGSQPLVLTLTPDGKNNLARPVDVTEAPDGTLLFSADDTSQIYRISKTQ